MSEKTTFKGGLEDVVAAQTKLCDIDGQKGELIYVGYDIRDLAENASFEEVVHLLLHLRLPNQAELDELRMTLDENAEIPHEIMETLKKLAPRLSGMGMLRTFVSMHAHFDPEAGDRSMSANENKALRIIAKIPTLIAAFDRFRKGHQYVPPKQVAPGEPRPSTAERFLYQLTGKNPIPEAIRAMDAALVLHAEHGFNASTFTARVVAATLSDIYSAVTAAIAALKGPLHGGANEEVIKTLRAIGNIAHVREYIENELANKRVIFGFGHRVYKTIDPRAKHL
ncbi:MAG TPA: citrate/2-methylcitrate synthase, partial [bacterium]|nr:citrate/2-methylcitrate synthase [bacterium]